MCFSQENQVEDSSLRGLGVTLSCADLVPPPAVNPTGY